MSEWSEVQLGDVVSLINGDRGRNYPSAEHRTSSGIPFINAGLLVGGRVRPSGDNFISQERFDLLRSGKVEVGDVLLCIRGSIGRVAVVKPDVVPGAIASSLVILRPSAEINSQFLLAYLQSPVGQQLISANDNGAAQPNVGAIEVARFTLLLPERATQDSLISTLSAIDDLIENNRRRVELLEEMARAVYREWFVHFRYPGHEDIPLVDSELGPIPEGWEAIRLEELVSTQYGYTESAHGSPVGPHYLRGMDINKTSYIDWSTVPYCPISDKDRAKFEVLPGDVFVIRMADPGKVGICEGNTDAVFASYLVRLRPSSDQILPYFLFFTLSDEPYQSWVTGASTGATRKSVSAKVMTEPLISLPPDVLQAEFTSVVTPLRSLLSSTLDRIAALRSTRDLLLPRLVSGRIDVSDLDLDLDLAEEGAA
jgi:type I restriction enzyme S subunit